MTMIELGSKFIRRGLWLFVFSLVIGFGPWAHYMHGAMEEVQPAFLKNVTLWWGCPWTLSVYVTQVGSLAMVLFGLCYMVSDRSTSTPASPGERLALTLCLFGIVSEFVAGYLFYFAVNSIWPNFYFTPIDEGKHLWLGVQGACIALCLAGAVLAVKGIGRAMDAAAQKEDLRLLSTEIGSSRISKTSR
jgi:hypothetical protein